jgi:ParB-like chromosome segregation protein Spo0J
MVKLDTVAVNIDEIYVPAKRRGTLDESKVVALAESIIEDGQKIPIHVRPDPGKNRYVLVEGLHRLEAQKALGEVTIDALIVMSRRK